MFSDRPLMAMQGVENMALVLTCSECLRTVGSLDTQLELLAGLPQTYEPSTSL